MNIRGKVKLQCKLHNITQKELAAQMGITENSLNITLSKGNPQLSTLEKIAEGLGITVSQLLSDEQEQPHQPADTNAKVLRCPHCGEEIELYVKAL